MRMLKNRSLAGLVTLKRVNILKNSIKVEGLHGFLEKKLFIKDSFFLKDQNLIIFSKCSYGLVKGLVECLVLGVSMRFFVVLTLEGLGYIIYFCKEGPLLRVGLTHYLCYKLDTNVNYFGLKNKLVLFGINKELVIRVGVSLYKKKKWDSYKGKGFRFLNEKVILKVGKKR